MSLSKKAVLEIVELQERAEQLSKGTGYQQNQATILLSKIKTIREIGLSSDEVRALYAESLSDSLAPQKMNDKEYRSRFDHYLAGKTTEKELRDWTAGQETITWTQGAAGGFIVPQDYDDTLRQTNAQIDPVLNPNVTSLSMTSGPFLQPARISGYDLSSITASLVGEGVQQTQAAVPPVLGAQLRADRIFKITLGATIEAEDDIPGFALKLVRASAIGLARKIGKSVMIGQGGVDISGVLQALGVPSVTNATAGKIVNTDISNVIFAVNRFYRSSTKAGFLMSDGAYKLVRNAVDNSGRPLLDFSHDEEQIFGMPVFVTPSLDHTSLNSVGVSFVLFGDLSSIVVRLSRPTVQRITESSIADITRGESAYVCRVRADAAYFDPSSGSAPPLVLAAWN